MVHRCDLCGKGFPFLNEIRRHMLSHLGIKPYVCDVCDQGFLSPNNRTTHFLRFHAQNQGIKCKVCGLHLASKGGLRRHVFTHGRTNSMHSSFVRETRGDSVRTNDAQTNNVAENSEKNTHDCTVCEQTFPSNLSLQTHMLSHSGRTLIGVQLTSDNRKIKPPSKSSDANPLQLEVNKKTCEILINEHGVEEYKCRKCPKSYPLKSNMKRHLQRHAGLRPFVCDECGKAFSYSTDLNVHSRVHTNERPYECAECHKSFKSKSTLRKHRNTHMALRPYTCNICGKGFNQTTSLQYHKRVHLNGKRYRFGVGFRIEIEAWTDNKEKTHVCAICGQAYALFRNYKRHMDIHLKGKPKPSIDKDEKPHVCSICNRCFTTALKLVRHKGSHYQGNPHVCTLCNRSYSTVHALRRHTLVHIADRQAACDADENGVMDIKHTDTDNKVKSYFCYVCQCTFDSQDSLLRHMVTHRAEKPKVEKNAEENGVSDNFVRQTNTGNEENKHICNVCDHTFSSKDLLRKHETKHKAVKRKHTDNDATLHICRKCDCTFSSKNLLREHAAVHNEEKRLECDICEEYFTDPSLLKRHMQIHTWDNTPFIPAGVI